MANRAFISQFSPQRTDPEALEQILVQRHDLLTDTVARLRESVLTANKHHLLFVGPRGAGKTHLTTLIHHRLKKQTKLAKKLRLAWLNEDETSPSFLKLLIRIYRDLASRYPDEFPAADLSSVYGKDQDTARDMLGTALLNHLGKRTLVVLIENLDSLFAQMPEGEQRTWRAFVQNHPVFATVATAQSLFPGVSDRTQPFFNFFDARHLQPLSVQDATTLLENIARLNEQPELLEFLSTTTGKARMQAIHHLSGGNPRLYIILSDFLTPDSLDRLVRPFEETVDKQLTAYYQERLRWLSAQQQEIVQFLCQRAHPIPVKEIAEGIFAAHSSVTSQLKQLREMGYVSFHPRGREVLYELAEPLMRLSFQVKETNNRQPLTLIVDFLRVWYDRKELELRRDLLDPRAEERAYFEAALAKLNSNEPNLRHQLLRYGLEDIDLEKCDEDAVARLRCLAVETNEAEDWARLGVACQLRGNYSDSISAFSSVIDLPGTSITHSAYALIGRGMALAQNSRSDEAIVDFTRVIEMPDGPVDAVQAALTWRGSRMVDSGQIETGIADYSRCIELPSGEEGYVCAALNGRGAAFFISGHCEEAIADFTRVIETKRIPVGQLATALNGRGMAFGVSERTEEQVADHTRVIDLPNAPSEAIAFALSNRSVAFGKMGDLAAQLTDLNRLIELPGAPTLAVAFAMNSRGSMLSRSGRFQEAIDCYDRVLTLGDAPIIVAGISRCNRGWTLGEMGRSEEALANFSIFFALSDRSVNTQLLTGYSSLVSQAIVTAAFGQISSPPRLRDRLSEFVDHFADHGILSHLGDALVRHLPKLAESTLNHRGLDQWREAWETASRGHPQMDIPLRLLGVGIAFLKSRDEGSLLALASEERRILREAFGLPPEREL